MLRNSRLLHPAFHHAVRRSAVGDLGLPDSCRIDRPGVGDWVLDPETGISTPPDPTLIMSGPENCRVQPDTLTQGRQIVVGDQVVTLHRYRASIPWDAPQILVDDVLTVLQSKDPLLTGRPLIVRDVKYDTFQVRRFLDLEDHPRLATPQEG